MGPEKRSPGVVILLSIVTCGIYSWYFIYSIARDLLRLQRDKGIPGKRPDQPRHGGTAERYHLRHLPDLLVL